LPLATTLSLNRARSAAAALMRHRVALQPLRQPRHAANRPILSRFVHKFAGNPSTTASDEPEQWYYFPHYFC
jgi:hypothetical protein